MRDSVEAEVWAREGALRDKVINRINKNNEMFVCVLNFIMLRLGLILSFQHYNNTLFI